MSSTSPGAARAAPMKVHDPAPPEGGGGKRTDWRKYANEYGFRHDALMKAMAEHPDGLTASELSALVGVSRASVRGYVTELVNLGLCKFDGVRKEGRAHVLVAFLTELGAGKAKWLLDDPCPYGTRAPKEEEHGRQ